MKFSRLILDVPIRYVVVGLASAGLAIVYALKINLSVAIVSMVNHTSQHPYHDAKSNLCPENPKNQPHRNNGPFDWDSSLQGTLLSSYFWGYLVSQIPGGRVAETFSAKWVLWFSVAVNVFCTMITPIAAKFHYGGILVVRAVEGIGGGVSFPAMHVLLARWAPPNERSVMSNIAYGGTAFGSIFGMMFPGLIADYISWEAIFYIMGGVSCLWLLLWPLFASDSPEDSKFIGEPERKFITASHEPHRKKKSPVPWKHISKSKPFYAILISHVFSNIGWYTILTELPTYMNDVLELKITHNSVFMALPFLYMWIFSVTLSQFLDRFIRKGTISITRARKIATGLAGLVPGVCFLVLSLISCSQMLTIFLVTLAVTSSGAMYSGFLSNHIDIAPNFAGTLMGLTNTAATFPGIIVPILSGFLTSQGNSLEFSWKVMFCVVSAAYCLEVGFYFMYADGEEQYWNRYPEDWLETKPLKSDADVLNYGAEDAPDKDEGNELYCY